jgi:hypothetical protein
VEPSVVAETRAAITPPPPASATAVEEGEAATETTITQAALEAPSEAVPSVEGAVVVLDEDLKASRPLIRVLVINDNHYGLTILFEL